MMAPSTKAVILLFILATCSPRVSGGRWIVTFKTANNWMAGYVGDIVACFQFHPVQQNSTGIHNVTESHHNVVGFENIEDCHTIPWRSFERGKTYMFGLDFIEDTNLERVRLFGKLDDSSMCKRKSLDAWHVEDVSFQSIVTGFQFSKLKSSSLVTDDDNDQIEDDASSINSTNNSLRKSNGKFKKTSSTTLSSLSSSLDISQQPVMMLIGPKCGDDDKELVLEDFNVSMQPKPCEFSDGIIYKNGDSFDDGCSGSCRCRDGSVSCVSRCPPSFAIGCRAIYIPGECCESFICDTTKSVATTCSIYEENDCETSNKTVSPGEYPWAAFIKLCDKKGCHSYCSGALISEQTILTASECLMWSDEKQASVDQVRVILGEHTLVLAEDRDIELGVESIIMSPGKSGKLALIKLKERVVIDRAVQPAVLPHSKEQCQQLLQPYCGLSMIGWANIGSSPKADQFELYKVNTRLEDQNVCPVTAGAVSPSARRRKPPPPSRHRDATLCVNLGNDEPHLSTDCGTCHPENDSAYTCVSDKNSYLCSSEKGRPIVSKVQVAGVNRDIMEVNIVVGVVTFNLTTPETPDSMCKKPAYRLGVGICQELDWISSH